MLVQALEKNLEILFQKESQLLILPNLKNSLRNINKNTWPQRKFTMSSVKYGKMKVS